MCGAGPDASTLPAARAKGAHASYLETWAAGRAYLRLPPAAAAAGLAAPPPAAAAPPSAGGSPPPIESMMTAGRMYIQYLRREGWGWGWGWGWG